MGNNERPGSANSVPKTSKLKWAAVIAAVGLAAGGGALFLVGPGVGNWTRQRVIDAAKEQGIVLEVSETDISLDSIHLREARASLEGVPGLTAYLQSVDVSLAGLKPNRIKVGGLIVQAVGTPTGIMGNVRSWKSRHPAQSATPKTEIGKAKLTWQESLDGPAFLVLDNVTFAPVAKPLGPLGEELALRAENAQVGAYPMTPLIAVVHAETEAIEIGIGANQWENVIARGGWKK